MFFFYRQSKEETCFEKFIEILNHFIKMVEKRGYEFMRFWQPIVFYFYFHQYRFLRSAMLKSCILRFLNAYCPNDNKSSTNERTFLRSPVLKYLAGHACFPTIVCQLLHSKKLSSLLSLLSIYSTQLNTSKLIAIPPTVSLFHNGTYKWIRTILFP